MDDENKPRRRASSGSGMGRLRSFTSDRLKKEGGENAGSDDENLNEANNSNVGSAENSLAKLKNVRDRVYKKERRVALNEPEVHIIGEIDGGTGFGSGVCCRWQFDFGNSWDHLGGYIEGQTQVDYPVDGDNSVWAHPLDVHFLCKGVQGWPRILLQVWSMDEFGRVNLAGYGFTHVPSTPGSYELDVATWRPVGSLKEEIAVQFLGNTPQLRDIDLLFSKAWSDRSRISSTSSGTVRINLDVILRNFHEHSVDI